MECSNTCIARLYKAMIDESIPNEGDDDDRDITLSFQGFSRHVDPTSFDVNTILLDLGFTCSVFKNKKLLKNVHRSEVKLRAYSNDGYQDSELVEDLPDFFTVWYNPNSMLHILVLCDVRKRFRVSLDTSVNNAFLVHAKNDKTLRFREIDSGLYMLVNSLDNNIEAYSCFTLVSQND